MNYAIILAGGSGVRAGGSLPKQFQYIGNCRMIWWSVNAFLRFDPECHIILVVHPAFLATWKEQFGEEERKLGVELYKIAGGESRFESVKQGLLHILAIEDAPGDAVVFIHDGARPLVTSQLIERGYKKISRGKGAIPVVPLTDSIRIKNGKGSRAVNRSDFMAVQTPQIFYFDDIFHAYNQVDNTDSLTDDASVAESYGLNIISFPGDPSNLKVTNPEDFIIANALCSLKSPI